MSCWFNMLAMNLWQTISQAITEATGEPFGAKDHHAVGGGCINSAAKVSDGSRSYFVKLNSASTLAMFEAEADGLRELRKPGAIAVPEPLATGTAEGQAFIVMEDMKLGGRGSGAQLGHELAQLHRATQERFGWFRDNTIGSTPQYNSEDHDWIAFGVSSVLERNWKWQLVRGEAVPCNAKARN